MANVDNDIDYGAVKIGYKPQKTSKSNINQPTSAAGKIELQTLSQNTASACRVLTHNVDSYSGWWESPERRMAEGRHRAGSERPAWGRPGGQEHAAPPSSPQYPSLRGPQPQSCKLMRATVECKMRHL